jgi:hypothetical protein
MERKKNRKSKQKASEKKAKAPQTPPEIDSPELPDYGGMNMSNFRKNLGCGG